MYIGISPLLYKTIYMISALLLTLYYSIVVVRRSIVRNRAKVIDSGLLYFYLFILTFFIGLRPVDICFGDMGGYDIYFKMCKGEAFQVSSEWLFDRLMWMCAQVMPSHWFFFIVMVLYVVPTVIAAKRLLPNYAGILLVFWIGAFVFWGGAVNGIRNAVALSLVALAITYIDGKLKDKLVCVLLLISAVGFHKSALLPAMCLLFVKLYPKPQVMFYFWFLSIPLSLMSGNSISSLFAGLGFDDRFSQYVLGGQDTYLMSNFSRTGFRWDFLLYSFMPVLLGWYVVVKRKYLDRKYLLLLGTYIYANAFWILVIRSSFSNRFAGLSWFIYPFVIAYPLLKFPVFKKNHVQKTSYIMFAHFGFTFFMWLIGK